MVTKREKWLLLRIGTLIRGDWSGDIFDGRHVQNWIEQVIAGTFDALDTELKPYEEEYGIYVEPEEAEEQPFATRNCDKGKCVHADSYRDQLPCLECSHLDGLRPAIANTDRLRNYYKEADIVE